MPGAGFEPATSAFLIINSKLIYYERGVLTTQLPRQLNIFLALDFYYSLIKNSIFISRMRAVPALITPELILLGLSFATIIGALAGLIPAKRAAELEPVEALRYE